MDIKPFLTPGKQALTSELKIDSLNLKLNQQLEVKVLSSQKETQSITVEILSTKKALQLQSNLPFNAKPADTLTLVVTKLTPVFEFKVLNPTTNIAVNTDAVVFKASVNNLPGQITKAPDTIKPFTPLPSHIISAKIISIDNESIQLKLYTSPTQSTAPYNPANKQQNILEQHNPIVTLNKAQIKSAENLFSKTNPLSQSFNDKVGQQIQLKINKTGLNPEFKIINNATVKLTPGDVITATVIKIENNTVELALLKNQSSQTAVNNKLLLNLSDKQLVFSAENKTYDLTKPGLQLLHPKQQLMLEVTKTGEQPQFKIMDSSLPNMKQGQVIPAVIIGLKNNQVQLQLQADAKSLATFVITLDKQQLVNSLPPSSTDSKTQATQLTPGKQIQLEVVKIDKQIEFKLLPQASNQQLNILNTIKQLYPIQEPPIELVNQLLHKLPVINRNEKIPDALKRLAKEILDSIPQIKQSKDASQFKTWGSQSGLFLEAKLAQAMSNKDLNVQQDFKNQLLKFQQALKQELEINTEKKQQSIEVALIKEMQQKTESSLARIILNQLASLPKEEASRQNWILDLPFINHDKAENIRVEIDREKQSKTEDDQENWSVNITVTPPGLATIHCKLSCTGQIINTVFWSHDDSVVQKINTQLDYLKTQLEKSGLSTGHMSASRENSKKEVYQQIKKQSFFDQKV